MTQHGNDTRHRRRRRGPGAPPDSDDILWEIFLRLPPLPSSLPRISIFCKRWRHLAADPEFLLRFRARHRKAPLLGLFKERGGWVSFTPVLDPPNRIPRRRFTMRIGYGGANTYPYHDTLLGCCHGRVLVLDPRRREVLVCDPITGEQHRIPLPPESPCDAYTTKGAVLCADGSQGHVHGGCHSSPFEVVLVQTFYKEHRGRDCVACVYSSETAVWSSLIWVAKQCNGFVDFNRPPTLVGGSLFWWLRRDEYDMEILEFDIARQGLSVIDRPPVPDFDIYCNHIIQGEHGSVGVATLSYPSLQILDWKADSDVSVAK